MEKAELQAALEEKTRMLEATHNYLNQLYRRVANPKDYPTHDTRSDQIDIKTREPLVQRLREEVAELEKKLGL